MTTNATGGRVWFDGYEITHFLRAGRQPLALDGDRVVFAGTAMPWAPGPTGVEIGQAMHHGYVTAEHLELP